ncbi:MAG: DUF4384 domain-containing protein [Gemmatimonadota bacterium]
MFTSLIGLALASFVSGPTSAPSPGPTELSRIASWVRSTERQRISLWTNHDDDPYRRGDEARVYFKAETDGYVTVLRIDTDGRIRVLFPREPWEDNFARGGRTFEVLDRNNHAFPIDDYPGVGYIFAVSSPDPYRYDDFVRGDHWDYRLIADGRVRGDPYVSMTDFASQIAGEGEYDYDIVPYYVEQHYDYPRFVCYDCHNYVGYSYWNPYHYSCNRFRIVVYDDDYYYPYRYNRGRNVVVVRPYRPRPRYVFKDYNGQGSYVTRVKNRPGDEGRRVVERDRTSADIGGRGSIPAPVEPRGRRTVDGNGQQQTGSDSPDSPRRRPGDQTGVNGDRPSTPGTQDEPRRRTDEPGSAKPNVLPRSLPGTSDDPRRRSGDPSSKPNVLPKNNPGADNGPERRREPADNPNLRPVDPGTPDVLPPSQRPSRDQPTSEPRRTESTRPESRSQPDQPRSEPRRSDPPPTRAEPRRDPPPSSPPRAEPRRADPPPQSRPQPTGDPQLRRRKPN